MDKWEKELEQQESSGSETPGWKIDTRKPFRIVPAEGWVVVGIKFGIGLVIAMIIPWVILVFLAGIAALGT